MFSYGSQPKQFCARDAEEVITSKGNAPPKHWIKCLFDRIRHFFGSPDRCNQAKLDFEGLVEEHANYRKAKTDGDREAMKSAKSKAWNYFDSYRRQIRIGAEDGTTSVNMLARYEVDLSSEAPKGKFCFTFPNADEMEIYDFEFEHFDSENAGEEWAHISGCFDKGVAAGSSGKSNLTQAADIVDEMYDADRSPADMFRYLEQLVLLAKPGQNLFPNVPPGLMMNPATAAIMQKCWDKMSPFLPDNSSRLAAMKILLSICSGNSQEKHIDALESFIQLAQADDVNLDKGAATALIDAVVNGVMWKPREKNIGSGKPVLFFRNPKASEAWRKIHGHFDGAQKPEAMRVLSRMFEPGRSTADCRNDFAALAALLKKNADHHALFDLSSDGLSYLENLFFTNPSAHACWKDIGNKITYGKPNVPDDKKPQVMEILDKFFRTDRSPGQRFKDLADIIDLLEVRGDGPKARNGFVADLTKYVMEKDSPTGDQAFVTFFFEHGTSARNFWDSIALHLAPAKASEALAIVAKMFHYRDTDRSKLPLLKDFAELMECGKRLGNSFVETESRALFDAVIQHSLLLKDVEQSPGWQAIKDCFEYSNKAAALQITARLTGVPGVPGNGKHEDNLADFVALQKLCSTNPAQRAALARSVVSLPIRYLPPDQLESWHIIKQHIPEKSQIDAIVELAEMAKATTPEDRLDRLAKLMDLATDKDAVFRQIVKDDSALCKYLVGKDLSPDALSRNVMIQSWKAISKHFAPAESPRAMKILREMYSSEEPPSATKNVESLLELMKLAMDTQKEALLQVMVTLPSSEYFSCPAARRHWIACQSHFSLENQPEAMKAMNALFGTGALGSLENTLAAFATLNQLTIEPGKNLFKIQLGLNTQGQTDVEMMVNNRSIGSLQGSWGEVTEKIVSSGLRSGQVTEKLEKVGNMARMRFVSLHKQYGSFVANHFSPPNRAEAMRIFSRMAQSDQSVDDNIRSFHKLVDLADLESRKQFQITVEHQDAGNVAVGMKISGVTVRRAQTVDVSDVALALFGIPADTRVPEMSEREKNLLAKLVATRCSTGGGNLEGQKAIRDLHAEEFYAIYRPGRSINDQPVSLHEDYSDYCGDKFYVTEGPAGLYGRLFRDNLKNSWQEKVDTLFSRFGHSEGEHGVEFSYVHPLLWIVNNMSSQLQTLKAVQEGQDAEEIGKLKDRIALSYNLMVEEYDSFYKNYDALRGALSGFYGAHDGLVIAVKGSSRNHLVLPPDAA